MVAIKTSLSKLPDYCDECQWYATRPHPCKGWTDQCELMCQCMDDDTDEYWIYNGNGRPNNCPLIEIVEDINVKQKGKWVLLDSESYPEPLYECSNCGFKVMGKYQLRPFCCECGCEMEVG